MHWKLRFFPTLKVGALWSLLGVHAGACWFASFRPTDPSFLNSQVLCLDLGRVGSRDPQAVEAIAERIRSELPSGCQLDVNGQLSSHREYSGLADFD